MRKTQSSMERSILGVKRKNRISNQRIREKTMAREVGYIIKELKFKHVGHVLKASKERVANLITKRRPFMNTKEEKEGLKRGGGMKGISFKGISHLRQITAPGGLYHLSISTQN